MKGKTCIVVICFVCVFVSQFTPDPENVNLSSSVSKPKGGRRRWGYVTGVLKGDDWDDNEDIDVTTTTLNKPVFISNDKRLQGDCGVNRYLGCCLLQYS